MRFLEYYVGENTSQSALQMLVVIVRKIKKRRMRERKRSIICTILCQVLGEVRME